MGAVEAVGLPAAGGTVPLRHTARQGLRLAGLAYLYCLLWVAAVVGVAWATGHAPLVISSGSMAPTLREGDLVLLGSPPAEVPPGTVVTFRRPGDGQAVTHRVVGVEADGLLVTKGDANGTPDAVPVHPDQLLGVSRFSLPVVGKPIVWLRSGEEARFAVWAALTIGAAVLATGGKAPVPARTRARRLGATAAGWRLRRWLLDPIVRRPNRTLGVVLAAELVAIGVVSLDLIATSSAAFTATTSNAGNTMTASDWDAPTTLAGTQGSTNCTIRVDETLWCWGHNENGEVGDGTTTNRAVPTQVAGPGGVGFLEGVVHVAGGFDHTCAARGDGTVWCWGYNGGGQLGDGTITDRLTPVQVRGPGGVGFLQGAVRVMAGDYHSCALKDDQTLWCWGWNGLGQLGDGTTSNRHTPVQVLGPGGVGTLGGLVDASAGGEHTCAVGSSGEVWCWGQNDDGQLGDGTTSSHSVPEPVVGPGGAGWFSGAVAVRPAFQHTCLLTGSGEVWCWGLGTSGQNGDGTWSSSTVPVQVVGIGGTGVLSGVTDLGAGDAHRCAVAGGQVVCWGANYAGQLGDGTTSYRATPGLVLGPGGSGLLAADAVMAGVYHSCAIGSGTGWCWGGNGYGQLGDGSFDPSLVPVELAMP